MTSLWSLVPSDTRSLALSLNLFGWISIQVKFKPTLRWKERHEVWDVCVFAVGAMRREAEPKRSDREAVTAKHDAMPHLLEPRTSPGKRRATLVIQK